MIMIPNITGELSGNIFTEYERRLQSHVAKLRYRRWTCSVISIPNNTTLFESNILFGKNKSNAF